MALNDSSPVRPQDVEVSKDILTLISRQTARQLEVCPLGLSRGVGGVSILSVAAVDPGDMLLSDHLQQLTGCRIRLVPAAQKDILRGIEMHYALPGAATDLFAGMELPAQPLPSSTITAEEAPEQLSIRTTVEEILQRAIRERATDVHIQPDDQTVYVRFRIDGMLIDYQTYTTSAHAQVISRIKILSNLDIAQNRLPQDGRFEIGYSRWVYDIRVSIAPTSYGEKAVLRLLPHGQTALDMERMGFNERSRRLAMEMIDKPYGMLLATGPTGSGKTTTMYTLISKIDSVAKNIVTVEDPVEYHLPHVSQIQVHPKIGLTFAAGLRSILRQDPDVILVGEIRDPETLEMAIQSALTGHLVLSTLHCNDAAAAAARMVDMGEEPFLIASSINGIISQRLVRRICVKCRETATISETTRRRLELPDDLVCYAGKGCENCRGTGYMGRISLFEIVPMREEIQDAIVRKASASEIRGIIRSLDIPNLRDDGLEKVRDGITSLEEFVRAVYEKS